MAFKNILPVSYLLFTTRGRIDRATYWIASIFIWCTFYVLFTLLDTFISYSSTRILYPLLFWSIAATATKRLHDSNFRGWWLLVVFIPVLGPLALIFLLGFRKGTAMPNRFGAVPGAAPDYFKNGKAIVIPHLHTGERIVDDVTQINPVIVNRVETPKSIEELQAIIRSADKPISIGGGRFSMGGQTASPHSIHIDMRELNNVIDFSPTEKTIKVQAGIRWCDIQRHIDKHDLSVKIMQTYANFTVGGALSVNCHGRYMGLGPVILSVLSLDVILANGELVHTSPTKRPELFYACVGCYNAVAVIVVAELGLADNAAVKRSHVKMKRDDYPKYFETLKDDDKIVFHNADIYPPYYKNIRAVSWVTTNKKPTIKMRLMPLAAAYPVERYFIGAFAKNHFGKWRREYIIDPIVFAFEKIHWRNYEAGYDALELEPRSRKDTTYVLQEYFVPVTKFSEFSDRMADIFIRNKVNVINVSVRHATVDSGSLLAWARSETFAFVVWYRQGTSDDEKKKVGAWTRELIDEAISFGGGYYLPYQPHATEEQFHKAYPNAHKLFEIKRMLDPDFKFRNSLWDKYYRQH